ncbi:MAG: SIR2 family protein [Planctomycetaceae bacterium]|nr:SIR2 family protein [Planctomycetaceae bacterium]
MTYHDPRQVVYDLRNHLAVHDRSLAFLLGAGTSAAVSIASPASQGSPAAFRPLIPAVAQLTEMCKSEAVTLGAEYAAAWTALESHCRESGKDPNIENILTGLRLRIDAIGNSEVLLGLDRDKLVRLESTICREIAKIANPPESSIPATIPHDAFANWIRKATRGLPLELFTTNYDVLIERSLERSQVPLFDGFIGSHEPFFSPDSLESERLLPPAAWVRLWKIHGSINWRIVGNGSDAHVIRSGVSGQGEMILPSYRKYDETRKQPYTALLDRLGKILNQDHALLFTCGFSFRDAHINALLFSIIDQRPKAHVFCLQYDLASPEAPLVKWARERKNLWVLAPNAAVIAGEWGEWRLTQPVENKNSSFMDLAFDSLALTPDTPGDAADEALKGRFRLGDFKWFCDFLGTMTPNDAGATDERK